MNLIHFSVAIIIFIILTSLILKSYTNFLEIHSAEIDSVNAKLNTFLAIKKIFSLGFPEKWDVDSIKQMGLADYLYKQAVLVTELNGIDRGYTLVNVFMVFDENCSLIAFNNTVRVYEGETEIPSTLYNQSFCTSNHLKSANVILNTSFSAYQSRLFLFYFSNNSKIVGSEYSLPYEVSTGFNIIVYPLEKMVWLSVDKLYALKNLNYSKAVESLISGNNFYLEVSE